MQKEIQACRTIKTIKIRTRITKIRTKIKIRIRMSRTRRKITAVRIANNCIRPSLDGYIASRKEGHRV